MKHTITVLVENRFGAFDRIATMFSGKGFNMESISIGETEIQNLSRMTIVTYGAENVIDQIVKQLNRLIDTVKVVDLTELPTIVRELALIKVPYQQSTMKEINNLCDVFRGNIVDINNKSMTIEITGPPEKIDAAVNVLMPFGIKEMARTGLVALQRGDQLKQRKQDISQN